MWRIKLAAVVCRLSPHPGPSALPGPVDSCSALRHHSRPLPSHPPQPLTNPLSLSPCHTQTHTVLNSCNIHQQPSHDTIYSVQPLLPRVLWLSSMQISHVLIVIIYLFFMEERKKGRGGVSSEIDLMTELKKRESAVLCCELSCHPVYMFDSL